MSDQTIVISGGEAVEYRDVPDFPGYRVGSDGSVWSCRNRGGAKGCVGNVRLLTGRWRRMKPRIDPKRGYRSIQLGRGNKHVLVHRLVLMVFVGPCPDGMEGCHNDGNPANNSLGNLRWGTPKENQEDRIRHGTSGHGERNPSARMTESQIRDIRSRHAAGETCRELADAHGISYYTAWDIVKRRSWVHI